MIDFQYLIFESIHIAVWCVVTELVISAFDCWRGGLNIPDGEQRTKLYIAATLAGVLLMV